MSWLFRSRSRRAHDSELEERGNKQNGSESHLVRNQNSFESHEGNSDGRNDVRPNGDHYDQRVGQAHDVQYIMLSLGHGPKLYHFRAVIIRYT